MKKKMVAVILILTLLCVSTVLAINVTNQSERTVLEDAYATEQGVTVLDDAYGKQENTPSYDSESLLGQNAETVMENVYGTQGVSSLKGLTMSSGSLESLSLEDDRAVQLTEGISLVGVEGTWTNQNGIISVSQTNDAKAYINGISSVNLELTAEVMIENDSSTSDAGVIFRASNLSTGTNMMKGYYVGIDAQQSRLLLGRIDNGWTGLSYVPMTINANQYYKLYIVAVDNNIKVYVDDVLMIDVTDTSPILTAGYIGFRANKTAASYKQIDMNNVNILSVTSGSWSTSYNPVTYSSTQGQDNKVQFYGYNYSDVEFSAQIKVGRDDVASDAGLIFRASNLATGTNAMKGYYVGLDANKQRLMLGKLNNGWTMLGEVYMDISANQNYKVTVKAVSNNIKVYVDDVLKIDAIDKYSAYSSGGIGLRANQTAAWYTDVEHKSITSSGEGSNLSVTSGSWSTNYSPALSYYSAHWLDSKATLNGGDSSFGNLSFSANVRPIREDDTSDAGLIFRATDLGTGKNALKGYYVGIDAKRDLLMLGKLNNNWTEISSLSMDISSQQYYKITVEAIENNIKVYVDDVLKIDYTDNDNPYLSGAIGFRANNTAADFKQVEVEQGFNVVISGTTSVGDTLTATVVPSGATATYQWQYSINGTEWTNISGATGVNYTISPEQIGRYLRVTATGTGTYNGIVRSSVSSANVSIDQTTGINTNRVYTITNVLSNYAANVLGNPDATNTVVNQYTRNGAANQKYTLVYVDNGEYKIEPMHAAGFGSVLSLNSSKQLVMDTDINSSNQRWYIVSISGGNYHIINKAYPSEYLSVNGSTTLGAYIYSSSNTNGAEWKITPVERNVNVRLLRHESFDTTFGVNAETYANQVFNHAASAFFNRWGLRFMPTQSTMPTSFTVDNCSSGYFSSCTSSCPIPSSHQNCESRHKCGLQFWHDVYSNYPTNDTYGLTTSFFTFSNSCASWGGGDHTVIVMSNATNTTSRDYLWNVRRVQHEIGHCFGGTHNDPSTPCSTEDCIYNGGFDDVYQYDQDSIWCDNCEKDFQKNKFQ